MTSTKTRGRRREQVTRCDTLPEGVLLYTKTQMAALLQVSMRCLNEMMANGQISYLKIGGKLVRFRASHVLRRLRETSFVCHGEKAVASDQWSVVGEGKDQQGLRGEDRVQRSVVSDR